MPTEMDSTGDRSTEVFVLCLAPRCLKTGANAVLPHVLQTFRFGFTVNLPHFAHIFLAFVSCQAVGVGVKIGFRFWTLLVGEVKSAAISDCLLFCVAKGSLLASETIMMTVTARFGMADDFEPSVHFR